MEFDPAALVAQNEALLKLPMHRIFDAVGDYTLTHLWYGAASNKRDSVPCAGVEYLKEAIATMFRPEHIALVRIFAARRGGYIRPHRDFVRSADPWTRVHIPLQTNSGCLNSEEDVVFHMNVGEIWLFDGKRPHSGGCFEDRRRLHLVIDFAPDIPVPALFSDPRSYCPEATGGGMRRPVLTETGLEAIFGLGAIATKANFGLLLDFLGSVHFEKHVSCIDVFDWLIEIGRRSGDPHLLLQAKTVKQIHLHPE